MVFLSACGTPAPVQPQVNIQVDVIAGEESKTLSIPAGSTAEIALKAAGIASGPLDRVEPPDDTVLVEGDTVRLVRVREEFHVEQEVVPFEHQVLRNETMPEGETRLVQAGVNGVQEITYRRVFEDDNEISYSPVKVVTIKESVPEILMVGSQAPFAPFPIPGRLAYLVAGNAWLIEGTTGSRRPVVTTGDLDGRVFSLSPDGEWLLFTRRLEDEENINALWAARMSTVVDSAENILIDLDVANVVHFADWKPGSSYIVAYSTVEPRASAPGWQANNDLNLLALNNKGEVRRLEAALETNMGGNYGWWGMDFAWSPDGQQIAYTRPDSVGLVRLVQTDEDDEALVSLHDIITVRTRADWAWTPGLAWSPDGKVLYISDHVLDAGSPSPEDSPLFDLSAILLDGGPPLSLVSPAGMFAYPLPSPNIALPTGERPYQVAYLQAIFPQQSDGSRYRVYLMDRDGSNRRAVFPGEGSPGMEPQQEWGAWSPEPMGDRGGQPKISHTLAVIYQGNLWLVDADTGEARQITGDDLVSRVDWK